MRVLVTGSTRGLGLELLGSFFVNGYDVVMNGRNKIDTDHEAIWSDASFIKPEDLKEKNIGIVVNNAFDKSRPITAGCSQVLLLNTAIEYFQESSIEGIILNINSIAAIDRVLDSDYCIAKQFLMDASKSKKKQAYAFGITIIDVYPGAIKTDWTKDRVDWDDLIDPKELAEHIVHMVSASNFYYDEVIIRRTNANRKK